MKLGTTWNIALSTRITKFKYKKTSKFEWKLDNIRIEKIISAPIWATRIFSWEVSASSSCEEN